MVVPLYRRQMVSRTFAMGLQYRNAFCYGQPSNMPGPQLVPLPTKIGDKPTSAFAFDHDPSDGFIISCRLSVVIDSLLPLLGTHKYGVAADSSQMLIANASRDLDSLERYNKTEAGSGKASKIKMATDDVQLRLHSPSLVCRPSFVVSVWKTRRQCLQISYLSLLKTLFSSRAN
jgi:hypothetical protein